MPKFSVTLLFDASRSADIEAETPEDAVDAALDEHGSASLCHHCARHLNLGDCYGAHVYADDSQVLDTTAEGAMRAQRDKLADLLREARSALARLHAFAPKGVAQPGDFELIAQLKDALK